MHRAGCGADGAPLAWPAASAPFPPAPEPHAPLPSLCSHALIHTTEVPHRRSPHPHLAPLFLGPTSSSDVLQRLDLIGADGAETRALALLQNLGFSPELRARPMRALSGGWRVRTCLAAAIFARPDVLMLDEPTNHLSIGAVLWLARELTTGPTWTDRIVLVVSHDRIFLDTVATDVLHLSGAHTHMHPDLPPTRRRFRHGAPRMRDSDPLTHATQAGPRSTRTTAPPQSPQGLHLPVRACPPANAVPWQQRLSPRAALTSPLCTLLPRAHPTHPRARATHPPPCLSPVRLDPLPHPASPNPQALRAA
eukprot:scaffold2645_cov112-Isochrysis_galbana.AAC.8